MPGNNLQLFSAVPHNGAVAPGTAANTAYDGTGTSALLFTAGSNGSRVERIQAIHLGSNAVGLLRLFWNNGGAVGTAANNSLIEELAMPLYTYASGVGPPGIFIRVPIGLPPNHKLYVTNVIALASGYQVTAFGGDY